MIDQVEVEKVACAKCGQALMVQRQTSVECGTCHSLFWVGVEATPVPFSQGKLTGVRYRFQAKLQSMMARKEGA